MCAHGECVDNDYLYEILWALDEDLIATLVQVCVCVFLLVCAFVAFV